MTEDEKWKAWLLLKRGGAVTQVSGDKKWNKAIAAGVSKQGRRNK